MDLNGLTVIPNCYIRVIISNVNDVLSSSTTGVSDNNVMTFPLQMPVVTLSSSSTASSGDLIGSSLPPAVEVVS